MFGNEELLTVIEFWGCEKSAVLFNSHNSQHEKAPLDARS